MTTIQFDDTGVNAPSQMFNEQCLNLVYAFEHVEINEQTAVERLNALAQESLEVGRVGNAGRAYQMMGYIHNITGNKEACVAAYKQSRQLYTRINQEYWQTLLNINEGEHYRRRGDALKARPLYQRAFNMAKSLDMLLWQVIAIVNEGLTLIALEQYDAAHSCLMWGLKHIESIDETRRSRIAAEIYYGLAQISLIDHNLPQARAHAEQAVQQAELYESRYAKALTARMMGDVLTAIVRQKPNSEDPDPYYERAKTIFQELSAEADVARTLYAQGISLAQRGDQIRAMDLFRESRNIFAKLGMQDEVARASEAQRGIIPN